jgi:hypothetical protein
MTKTGGVAAAAAIVLLFALGARAEGPNPKKVPCGQIVEDYAVSHQKSVDETAARVHADTARVTECLKANGTEVSAQGTK